MANELRRSPLAAAVAALTPRGRTERAALHLALRLEEGPFRSATARELLRERHGVDIGAHSYGACFRIGALPPGVTVGRYVSMATQVAVFRRNHPTERLSMHPAFYNPDVGPVEHDDLPSRPLEIGHDAWLAHQSVVLPGCTRIGIGDRPSASRSPTGAGRGHAASSASPRTPGATCAP